MRSYNDDLQGEKNTTRRMLLKLLVIGSVLVRQERRLQQRLQQASSQFLPVPEDDLLLNPISAIMQRNLAVPADLMLQCGNLC